jgi:hypothetical protein
MNNANVFLLLQHFIVFSIPCLWVLSRQELPHLITNLLKYSQ